METAHDARARDEAIRVLGIDPALDRVPPPLDVLLAELERLAGGDAQLVIDDVDARDHLGHGVLDLDAGVHLDEIERPVLVEELESAGAAIANVEAGLDADASDRLSLFRGDERGGALLEHLLVPPLHGAIALPQMHRVALTVGENLDLDVARALEVLFHVHLIVAEGSARLLAGEVNGVVQGRLGVHDPHAASATTAGGLDQDRIAEPPGDLGVLRRILPERLAGAGHAGHAGGPHRRDRAHLVAHQPDRLRTRTDEDEAGTLHPFGEIRVLAEEAVAGMDRLGIGDLGRGDDRRDVEVAFQGRGRPDAHRLVGHAHVLEVAVHGGMHRDRLDPEAVAGPQDAQRDLAAIGDDDLVQHGSTDHEQRLVVLDGLAVLHQDRHYRAVELRRDRIEHLHRFDDAEGIPFLTVCPT